MLGTHLKTVVIETPSCAARLEVCEPSRFHNVYLRLHALSRSALFLFLSELAQQWCIPSSLVLLILSFRWLSLQHVMKLSQPSPLPLVSQWRRHLSHSRLFIWIIPANTVITSFVPRSLKDFYIFIIIVRAWTDKDVHCNLTVAQRHIIRRRQFQFFLAQIRFC